MKTGLRLFGLHLNMASQSRRRWLVTFFYAIFLVLIVASWMAGPSGNGASVAAMEFTIFAGPILGGYLTGWSRYSQTGIVKPFGGNEVLKYCSKDSRSALSRFFYPYPKHPDADEIRNDERDLNRRNYAHYLAYRILGVLFGVAFLIDFMSSSRTHTLAWTGFSVPTAHHMIRAILQAGYVLTLTLPAAILLWTEPDMENDQEPIS
jgi:hypothetical protein